MRTFADRYTATRYLLTCACSGHVRSAYWLQYVCVAYGSSDVEDARKPRWKQSGSVSATTSSVGSAYGASLMPPPLLKPIEKASLTNPTSQRRSVPFRQA